MTHNKCGSSFQLKQLLNPITLIFFPNWRHFMPCDWVTTPCFFHCTRLCWTRKMSKCSYEQKNKDINFSAEYLLRNSWIVTLWCSIWEFLQSFYYIWSNHLQSQRFTMFACVLYWVIRCLSSGCVYGENVFWFVNLFTQKTKTCITLTLPEVLYISKPPHQNTYIALILLIPNRANKHEQRPTCTIPISCSFHLFPATLGWHLCSIYAT